MSDHAPSSVLQVMTIASVSEDTHVNIWNLENVSMQELEPIASVAIKDKVLPS